MENGDSPGYEQFIQLHRPQLLTSVVPEHFWPVLYEKLKNQIFDSGNAFSLLLVDYDGEIRRDEDFAWTLMVTKEDGIKMNDPNEIYLIDHAWTFRITEARKNLQEIPSLRTRLSNLMGIDNDIDGLEDEILRKIWRYSNMYSINADSIEIENQMPIWYVMDELGSGINHSDTPNFRVIPFFYIPDQLTYSLLFPIVDTDDSEYVTRNFVERIKQDSREKDALLLPWKYSNFTAEDFTQTEPNAAYFLEGHIEESLPNPDAPYPVIDANRPLRVFSQYELINKFLTDDAFEIVTDETEADILWYVQHFKGFKEFSETAPNKFVNQFPFENVLTIKDLLSIVCRRGVNVNSSESSSSSLVTSPKWLPTTFNLKTELVKFVAYYQKRAEQGLDNHWIVKPWNLARGLDTHITNDIGYLMRLPETGPKIAQKYIERPILFDRPEVNGKVKFDIRYVILLKGTDPLDAYIYKNFFLRFANKPFGLTNFDDYEKHFTVMNYSEFNLRHVPCAEFLELWKEQYPKFSWFDIETEICQMFREMFMGAIKLKPPCGIGNSQQSRALYAADLMLSWDKDDKMTPKLLEVNWTPDCKRACDYYPGFYNDIFKLLFLDQMNEEMFRVI